MDNKINNSKKNDSQITENASPFTTDASNLTEKSSELTNTLEPESSEASQSTVNLDNASHNTNKPKPRKFGKWVLLLSGGCLIICCVVIVLGVIFSGQIFNSVVSNASLEPDSELTTLSQDEFDELAAQIQSNTNSESPNSGDPDFEANTGGLISSDQVEVTNDLYTVSLTEEQLLYLLTRDISAQVDPTQWGLKIDQDLLRIEVSSTELLTIVNESLPAEEQLNLDENMAANLFLRIDIATTSDNKSLTIQNISTGNTLIDNFIPADLNAELSRELESSFANSFTQGDTSIVLESIEFVKDEMKITFRDTLDSSQPQQ